ncbi:MULTISPECIES: o-succinylbenzoate synthase [unclassified Corynebacterium]|uniref:o-succinylbenzoate synthase n=1 Tax=unclassified Corynebacterium TaxID=2624378 RepID=UPI0029CA1031|nr:MULTISPECIES: o-succinylbenzoate synthase [unclassified Corynebacterium]WPF66437.1 o-succinylbenzoate synthase [Corynebacterium sp. 22KM0430]WPF68927.1 o-succinylbenzoate synthase [Corynebacterium sp. 21KM1197]
MTPSPSLDDLLDRIHVVALPMRARFRGVTTREALLIEGPQGWGEWAPFVEYSDEEAATWLAGALEAAFMGLPPTTQGYVEVNATIPAVEPQRVPELLARYPGCRTVKIKVAEKGQTLTDDVARVEAVRAEIPQARIRVDANRGWTLHQALEAARHLGSLDYMEQPCATVEELAALREALGEKNLNTRVAADESIRRARDPYRVAQLHAADVAVLKVAPLGGVRRLLDIARHMGEHAMSVTVASALDTAVGMNAGLVAAAALPHPQAPAGLGTQSLFIEDVAAPRSLVDGRLSTAAVVPEEARLRGLAASAERRQWWIERLGRCLDHLH